MADFIYDFLCGHQIPKTGKTEKPEPNEIMSMQLYFSAQFWPKSLWGSPRPLRPCSNVCRTCTLISPVYFVL
eukprot:676924-Pelagomonas_calceolata.AAC.2